MPVPPSLEAKDGDVIHSWRSKRPEISSFKSTPWGGPHINLVGWGRDIDKVVGWVKATDGELRALGEWIRDLATWVDTADRWIDGTTGKLGQLWAEAKKTRIFGIVGSIVLAIGLGLQFYGTWTAT